MAQVAQSVQPSPNMRTSLDYSLPLSFADTLLQPYEEMIDALLGPLDPSFVSVPAKDGPKVPFLSAMATTGDTITPKGALAHKSTDSPIVDLFYELTPGVKSDRLYELLEAAWKKDPKSTLQIILQGRSIHEGKSMKEETFKALAWVWDNHPRTLLANLHLLVDPTCKRHKSKAREEAKEKQMVEKALRTGINPISIGDDDKMEVEVPGVEVEVEQEYPPRPHGAYKDLINILILAINEQFTTSHTGELTALNESMAPGLAAAAFKRARINKATDRKLLGVAFKTRGAQGEASADAKRRGPKPKPGQEGYKTKKQRREERQKDQTFQQKLIDAHGKKARHALLRERLQKALADQRFSALYLTVIKLFADALRDDLAKLKEHQVASETDKSLLFGLSFAAKWVPSPAKGGDKQLFFATSLSKVLFPVQDNDGLRRKTLQREVLSPLRAALKVPETKMVQGEWKIDYTSVPGRAMQRHASSFMKHDPQGFAKFLRKAHQGHVMVAGASMMPHELLIAATEGTDPVIQQLADLQWKSLVDSIRSSSANKLDNCIAVADVSGSMGSLRGHWARSRKLNGPPQPIEVCIALTLLLGELAEAPWSGSFLTFDDYPVFMTIDPTLALSKRANELAMAPWGGSTHFGKTFDLILETAKREKLAPEHMVKTVFVFSDMQFDAAAGGRHGETEHQTAKRKFEEAGYPFPEMVYWNLASGYGGEQPTHKPVKSDTEGVALMSGFSGALMKYFLGQMGEDEEMEGEVGEEADEIEAEEANDMGWEEVEEDGQLGGWAVDLSELKQSAGEAVQEAREKKKKDPMDHVKKILQAESLQGVVIVD